MSADVGFTSVPADGAVAAAVTADTQLLGGLVAIVVLATVQLVSARREAPAAMVVGIQQMVLGLGVVLVTGLGVLVG